MYVHVCQAMIANSFAISTFDDNFFVDTMLRDKSFSIYDKLIVTFK